MAAGVPSTEVRVRRLIKRTTHTVHLIPESFTTVQVSMPDNLTSGNFQILSLIEGNPPASVGRPYIGLQFVHLNGDDTIV